MMVITTRKQRETIRKMFGYSKLYVNSYDRVTSYDMTGDVINAGPISYREFRRRVQPTYGCDGAVAVDFCGAWVCVERDGYGHT